MNKTILITGASGFLGSYIAEKFVNENYEVLALRRKYSNLWRCQSFINKIRWINIEANNWKSELQQYQPVTLIHAAWNGVPANDRYNWEVQIENLSYLMKVLDVSGSLKIKQIIGLGSQAEYGNFEGKINEEFPLNPNTAYGTVKLMACELLKSFSEYNNIKWYWLRLFPLFGEKEDSNWFIPSVIMKLQANANIELTLGLQKYAYMYVCDFAQAIFDITRNSHYPDSGIYNLSGNRAFTLKEIATTIKAMMDSTSILNFGALPYRPNQTMHMEGNTSKFERNIGRLQHSDFSQSLIKTINYYTHNSLSDHVK